MHSASPEPEPVHTYFSFRKNLDENGIRHAYPIHYYIASTYF
ncbi:hypothetical protein LTSEINV_0125, partial [Salmonella enterica subsp. enterica serovar Inverness str. R8-3668]